MERKRQRADRAIEITEGQVHDVTQAPGMLAGALSTKVLADICSHLAAVLRPGASGYVE